MSRRGAGTTRIFIRGLRVDMSIGVFDSEKQRRQPVVVSVEAQIDNRAWLEDDVSQTVSYDLIADAVRAIAAAGHIELVETFAERIAAACLGEARIQSVTVRVEKVAVYDFADAAGVEISRSRA